MLYYREIKSYELTDLIKVDLVSCDNEIHYLSDIDMLEVMSHGNYYTVVVTYQNPIKEMEVYTVNLLTDIKAFKCVEIPLDSKGQIKIM